MPSRKMYAKRGQESSSESTIAPSSSSAARGLILPPIPNAATSILALNNAKKEILVLKNLGIQDAASSVLKGELLFKDIKPEMRRCS
jgi:hypothetical protein